MVFWSLFEVDLLLEVISRHNLPCLIFPNSQSISEAQMMLDTWQHFMFSNQCDREKWLPWGPAPIVWGGLLQKAESSIFFSYYFKCRQTLN
jgi:hypothetical protein